MAIDCRTFLVLLFVGLFASLVNGQDGKCVMKGVCDQGAFGHVPCVAPADAAPEMVTDEAALATFGEICPNLVGQPLCCDKDQIMDMKNTFQLFAMFLKPCQSCFVNYMNVFCNLICSPNQSKFTKVLRTAISDETQKNCILEVDFVLHKDFASGIYESCKNVTRFKMRTIDVVCKPWSADKCNFKRMLQYIASDLEHNGHNPYQVDLLFEDSDTYSLDGETFYPLNDKFYKCSDTAPGKEACSCEHCPQSC